MKAIAPKKVDPKKYPKLSLEIYADVLADAIFSTYLFSNFNNISSNRGDVSGWVWTTSVRRKYEFPVSAVGLTHLIHEKRDF